MDLPPMRPTVLNPRVGIVVIGRNEGPSLRKCLASLPRDETTLIVYVDSGSTDGSLEYANAQGLPAHSLDSGAPFSPARGRREGATLLLAAHPELEFLQFVDGDCEVHATWTKQALDYLSSNDDVAIVCGTIAEKNPNKSIYNQLNAKQFNAPLGDIDSCGGIFMTRASAYVQAGGFNETLVTREEEELCQRIRSTGSRVVRLPAQMALHDTGLTSFRQWWARAVWGGYGDAIRTAGLGGQLDAGLIRRTMRHIIWAFAMPFLALIGLVGAMVDPRFIFLFLCALIAYCFLFIKLGVQLRNTGESFRDAATFSLLMIIRKVAVGYGFARFYVNRALGIGSRPDPHSA